MRGDLYKELYDFNVNDLYPLRKVTTEAERESLSAKGYSAGYTVDEWRQTFPEIDPDKIYYLCGLNVDTAYYDGIIYIPLHIYGKQIVFGSAEELQQMAKKTIARQQEHLQKKEYVALLLNSPDGVCGDILKNILERDGPSPEYYHAFMVAYQTKNCNTSVYDADTWTQLAAMKSEEQKAETKQYIDRDFPTGTAIIYRGWGGNSARPESAASWTSDINVAVWMASRRGDTPIVTAGKVKCEDIIEYTPKEPDSNGESEVIVRPGTVFDCHDTVLMDSGDERTIEYVNDVLDMFGQYKNLLMKVYRRKSESLGHNAGHSCRVLMHSLLLARMQGVSVQDRLRLAEASVYHDIGRTTDNTSEGHGRASAEIYRRKGAPDINDPIVAFIIEAHSIDDDKAEPLLATKKDIAPENRRKAVQLLQILKDADALDRVRFGRCGEGDGLDVKFLRYKDAWLLVPFAEECLSELKLPDRSDILYEGYTEQTVRRIFREYFLT